MQVNNVSLEAVAVKESQYPTKSLPEIAFAGKSNVGKSSLINCMAGRKALARASQTPGKTRTINFYNVEDALYFVDLPGYGYAKASKSEPEKWGAMVERYLGARGQLRAIVLLIDIRHVPGENDTLMYEWLKYYGHKIIIAATKCDKLKRGQVKAHANAIRQAFSMDGNGVIIPFSSETRQGRDELWEILEGMTFSEC